MSEELETYLQVLEIKDNNKDRYFVNITGEKQSKSGMVNNIPLMSIKQLRKRATGADKIRGTVEQAIKANFKSITIVEYPNCSDDAIPDASNTFDLIFNTTPKKRNNRNMGNRQEMYGDNNFVDRLNDIFGTMGVPGGLQGFMQATAQSMTIAERYEDAKQSIADLKYDNKEKDTTIQKLKEKVETLTAQVKDEKDRCKDIQREYENKINETKQQVGLLGLFSNFAGAFAAKTEAGQKLAGFLSDAPTPSEPPTTPEPSISNNDTIKEIDPQMAQYYNAIEGFYKELDMQDLEKFSTIVQFVELDPTNLNNVTAICKKLYLKQQNASQNGSISEVTNL